MATETGEGGDGADDAEESADQGAPVVDDGSTAAGSDVDAETAPPTGEPEPALDETSTDEGRYSQFARSVIVTTGATMLGMAAGIASMLFATSSVGGTPDPDSLIGFAILMLTVFAQFPLYTAIGIDSGEFDTKAQLYVFAMTFFMWFITWSVLLTTGGLL